MAKTRKKSSNGFLGATAYALFLCLVLVASTAAGWVHRSKALQGMIMHSVEHKDPKVAFGGSNSVVLLLLGCDEDRFYRGVKLHGSNIIRQYARSDMILLVKLDFDQKRITAISIPRDTECTVPGYKTHKINAYFSIAPFDKSSQVPVLVQRASLTQKAVESLLPGVHIDQSVVLNFDAFKNLVDLVGGVDINVPKKMDYVDKAGELYIHLKPGHQHLDGEEAMGYVRFRHDVESDFGRQGRQKDFMLAFKGSVISNWTHLPEVIDGGIKVFNGSLNDDQISSLLEFSKAVPQSGIQMGMVPVLEKGRHIVLDKAKVKTTLKEFGFVDDAVAER